jgi:hypothetical protein
MGLVEIWIIETGIQDHRITRRIMMDEQNIIIETKDWIQTIVIGLNLCPFARPVLDADLINYVVSDSRTNQDLKEDLIRALEILNNSKPEERNNTLLIHPEVLQDFFAYNDFLDTADQVLEDAELGGVIQIASFHPAYQFIDTQPDDPANYTNRSPHPMLHLLKEDEISKVVDLYPDVDQIPQRNINTLRSLGIDHIQRLYQSSSTRDK